MAVTYNVAVKTARMTATRDYFADGTLEIGTAGMGAVLATFGLSAGGGSISGDTWTIAVDAATVVASGTGTAAAARFKNNGGSSHLTGLTVTLTGGGGDLTLDNTSLVSGQNATFTGGTLQHAT